MNKANYCISHRVPEQPASSTQNLGGGNTALYLNGREKIQPKSGEIITVGHYICQCCCN